MDGIVGRWRVEERKLDGEEEENRTNWEMSRLSQNELNLPMKQIKI